MKLQRIGTRALGRGAVLWRTSPVGATLLLLAVGLAVVGPYVAPYTPSEVVGVPYQAPDAQHPLGTDQLGRDVLSRGCWGGGTLLVLGLFATWLAYAVGLCVGLVSGFVGGKADLVMMRIVDLKLAFPSLLFVLIIVSAFPANAIVLGIAVAVSQMPSIIRIVRAATMEVSVRPFVEAAIARGEPLSYVTAREILPNIRAPIAADIGIRYTACLLLVASVGFLGLGITPPDANWALMISENGPGFSANPAAVLAPAVLIATVMLGGNLLADGFLRGTGRRTNAQEQIV